ncbi:hypothetical protein SAMN05216266_101813 [Amycolatopsis marina]|uniref:Uncharacterized protein n=1 Tax=Amycolatopsis marina TaxID=490629 RepID=A0A1I0W8Q0_9PSEU|nr:hypothetical protein [Amycolatopsis marina]SFA84668.1 hypothetical protein SAMN05216266_101813 [Amycolatopsis marina]
MGQVDPALRSYLHSLDAESLVGLLCEQADRSPHFRRELEVRAGLTGNQGSDVAEAHRLLDDAVPASLEPHGAGFDLATKMSAVLDTLQRLLDAGTQADLSPLARRAVDEISSALGELDDASGAVGAELGRAVTLYARACAAHPPPPDSLADWILGIELDGPGWPEIHLADFADALGEAGLQRISTTVDALLADGQADGNRLVRAERLHEQVAEATGDVDLLVDILSRKLPRLDVSLKIVRVLRGAGRHSEAIAHAARAFARDKQPQRDAAEESHDEAVALLHDRAGRGPDEADELVRVLLAEERVEEAWQAADRYGCSLELRLEVADSRAAEHPGEVIGVYRSHVEALIAHKEPHYYREAAKQLRKLRTLHRRADTAEEFSTYLAELVQTHRRKTRLLAEVRAARIALPKAALAKTALAKAAR